MIPSARCKIMNFLNDDILRNQYICWHFVDEKTMFLKDFRQLVDSYLFFYMFFIALSAQW